MKKQRGEITLLVAAVCFIGMTVFTLSSHIDHNRAATEAVAAENAELKQRLQQQEEQTDAN